MTSSVCTNNSQVQVFTEYVYFFKVIIIFGLYGALRKYEFLNVKVTDVSNQGNLLLINIAETKTDKPRAFIILEKDVSIVNKYISLRPNKAKSDRFFLRYQMGKCTCQVIGIHKLESIPREIASYLNLETVEEYTCHAFRRTSATVLADAGADNLALKRHGGWKSDAVVQGYIEESVEKKTATANIINSFMTKELPVNNSTKIMKRDFHDELSFAGTSAHEDQQSETKKQKLNNKSDEDNGVNKANHKIPVLAEKKLSALIEKGAVFQNCSFHFH